MKALLFIIFVFTIHLVGAKSVSFTLDIARFRTIDGKSYIEAGFAFDCSTLRYKRNSEGKFQASVRVLMQITRKNDSAVVWQDLFNWLSLPLIDTTPQNTHMISTELRRVPLPAGNYWLSMSVIDNYNNTDSTHIQLNKNQRIRGFQITPPSKDTISDVSTIFSDIIFIRKIQKATTQNIFVKHNFEIIPYVCENTFIDQDSLRFYVELYHSTRFSDSLYRLKAQILDGISSRPIDFMEFNFPVRKASAFDAFNGYFNIQSLTSNTYLLKLELTNKAGKLLAFCIKKFYVIRSQPINETPALLATLNRATEYEKLYNYPENKLNQYLPALHYIATPNERSFLKALATYTEKKNFFVSFWEKRANISAGEPPEKKWQEYLARIEYANQQYRSALRNGWETDRGRVLLTFGVPNDIQNYQGERDKYPYQIWSYNKIGVQSNVIFVFYDRDLATNEYPLLHSNKYGEYNNPQWRALLLKSNPGGADMEDFNSQSGIPFLFRDDNTMDRGRNTQR